VDVEEVQFWISRSEAKIQDRTLDPHVLKTNLNEIQSEITGISEQLDSLLANGKVISEKTECSQEKELVLSTTTNLTEQLGQLKQLIQDKKNAANDAIDAWQRFLQFHGAVLAWCEEKEAFLAEPFTFTNLSSAKLKLQDYTTAIKSIKSASKNISEMEKELKKISLVGSSGNLCDKLADVERDKAELESQLMEKHAILSEMTEEWDQSEKKLKETKAWAAKARESLENLTNKKRPLRDQLNMRDKMSSDIRVQSKRVTMALEKLKVDITHDLHVHDLCMNSV
jgi:nesprin-1